MKDCSNEGNALNYRQLCKNTPNLRFFIRDDKVHGSIS